MSRTYDIVCHECKVGLWIGQSERNERGGKIYTVSPEIDYFADFLFAHKGHPLEFDEDQRLWKLYDYKLLHDEDNDE
jgi:hypothetical protein